MNPQSLPLKLISFLFGIVMGWGAFYGMWALWFVLIFVALFLDMKTSWPTYPWLVLCMLFLASIIWFGGTALLIRKTWHISYSFGIGFLLATIVAIGYIISDPRGILFLS